MYWALKEREEIGDEIRQKVENFYTYCRTNRYWYVWRNSYVQYYRGYFSYGSVSRYGEQGEARKVYLNQYKNVLQHLSVLVTSTRPDFQPKTVNTDVKSSAQAILAYGLLEYYMREKQLEDKIKDVVESALMYGEGYLSVLWDETEGDPYAAYEEDGEKKKVKTGDLVFNIHNPMDVIRDVGERSFTSGKWASVVMYKNKYEFAAKYPKYKDEIENQSYDQTGELWRDLFWDFKLRFNEDYTDIVPITYFWHQKTTALPNGRQTIMLTDGTVLSDGPLPYQDLPIFPIVPQSMNDTPFGYTVGFDLLSVQEVHDMCASIMATNINTFGLQNIAIPNNSNITPSDVTGGLRFLEYSGERGPEVMNLLQISPDVKEMLVLTERMIETLSGINSVSRGNPQGDMSGAAMALVQSMAIQFNSGLQHSYALFLERVGTAMINTLKRYAAVPRIATIAGKDKRPYLKKFTRDDIQDIDRVFVDVGNPMARTTTGKLQIAQDFLKMGVIQSPDEYMQVFNTGNLWHLTSVKTDELNLIKDENEKLSQGLAPVPAITDDHFLHIQRHKGVIANSEVRQGDAEIVGATLNHIQEHLNLLKVGDPELLMMNNQKPLQAQAGPAIPPAPAAAGPGTNEMTEEMQPNMPSMPENPLTEEKFNPETGGL